MYRQTCALASAADTPRSDTCLFACGRVIIARDRSRRAWPWMCAGNNVRREHFVAKDAFGVSMCARSSG
eukprot:4906318-Pleurochrysis_carterae.AAC.3